MSTLNRHSDPRSPDGVVDINDHILHENILSTRDQLGEAERARISSIDVSDEIILEGEPILDAPPKKRFRPGQIIILSVTAVVALGGVASFFTPGPVKPTPISAVQNAAPATPPSAAVTLPAGLSFEDKSAPAAALTPMQAEASPVAAVSASSLPSTSTVAPAPKLESNDTPVTAPSVTSPTNSPSGTPASAPQADAAKMAPVNPIAAQVEEAKQLMVGSTAAPIAPINKVASPTKAEPVPTAKVNLKETVAKQDSQPSARQPVPTAQKPSPSSRASNKPTPALQPKAVAKVTTDKPVLPRKAPAVAANEEMEAGAEMIKALVTTSAEAFGLQSIMEGVITLERNRGASSQRFTVGDRLPSGEQILRIDARSMTLVTDRSVIRFN